MVPDSFEAFEGAIKETYEKLVAEGKLVPQPDTAAPSVPLDLEAAKKAGKVSILRCRFLEISGLPCGLSVPCLSVIDKLHQRLLLLRWYTMHECTLTPSVCP